MCNSPACSSSSQTAERHQGGGLSLVTQSSCRPYVCECYSESTAIFSRVSMLRFWSVVCCALGSGGLVACTDTRTASPAQGPNGGPEGRAMTQDADPTRTLDATERPGVETDARKPNPVDAAPAVDGGDVAEDASAGDAGRAAEDVQGSQETPSTFGADPQAVLGSCSVPLLALGGREERDRLGAVCGCGDLDGDGRDDLVVAGDGVDGSDAPGTGAIYVLSGLDAQPIHRFEGLSSGDGLGRSVACAGDVDGDGWWDIVVGGEMASPTGLLSAGRAVVFSGADGRVLLQAEGDQRMQALGASVSGAGDVDDDGYADVVVGAPRVGSPHGRPGSAFVFSGSDGAALFQFQDSEVGSLFGIAVAGGADLDEDGGVDIVVGASWASPGDLVRCGSVFVYSGTDGQLIRRWDGEFAYAHFGMSVAVAGDVDADGHPDVIVGTAAGTRDLPSIGVGGAFVFSGRDGSLLQRLTCPPFTVGLGESVAGAGDIDRDGHADLIVGAVDVYSLDGSVLLRTSAAYVFSGMTGGVLEVFERAVTGPRFGGMSARETVAAAGDIDGDGYGDVLVAAPWAHRGRDVDVGAAYAFSLRPCLGSR